MICYRCGFRGIAQKLLKRNRPVDEIVEDTGLIYEEVEGLRIES